MQALVLSKDTTPDKSERYDPLSLSSVPTPEVGSDHTLIQIHAAALNHRDVFIRQGLYPRIVYGSILGSDGSGIEVSSGQRVLINPSVNWEHDPLGPEDAAKYGMLGLLPFPGTFAEYVAVPKRLVHPIPPHLSFEEAAALPLAGLTAWRAVMSKGGVGTGSVVLVSGIGGGVALFALQFAVAAGAKVFVTSSDPEKIRKAVTLGAAGGVNYKDDDWPKQLTSMAKQPVDVVIDGAGGDSIAAYTKLLRVGGKLVSYGATTGSIASVVLPVIFLKQLQLLGSTMGNEKEFAQMVKFVEQHRIRPVVNGVWDGLGKAEDIFDKMRKGSQFGKLVLRIRSDTQGKL
ncbi:hypothetical protein PhCBS80983_g05720 [Powellomyces hirtus]|uniref:Enoyl reductase (ER) domain-containing protein n=1 Tax=Powellomyces hirtus TaxID=109895 RepID=A0A507DVA6_9FUNG|nr:hypothetical protein PhCBS80983_g05720 [Powellomyces hirtus]